MYQWKNENDMTIPEFLKETDFRHSRQNMKIVDIRFFIKTAAQEIDKIIDLTYIQEILPHSPHHPILV